MTEDTTLPGDGLIITVSASKDPASDLWLMTGPYVEAVGADDALAAYSYLADDEEDAMEEARHQAAQWPGCRIIVYGRDGSVTEA